MFLTLADFTVLPPYVHAAAASTTQTPDLPGPAHLTTWPQGLSQCHIWILDLILASSHSIQDEENTGLFPSALRSEVSLASLCHLATMDPIPVQPQQLFFIHEARWAIQGWADSAQTCSSDRPVAQPGGASFMGPQHSLPQCVLFNREP